MKFVIGEPVAKKNTLNSYEVKVEFMHGDADAYTEELFEELTEEEALNMVRILREVDKLSRYSDDFSEVEGFDEVFESWPYDVTSDYNYIAALEDYSVFYYNDIGVKFHVKIEA